MIRRSEAAEVSAPGPAIARRVFSLDNRYLAPVLVTGILLAGQLSYGILESYPKTVVAIGAAIGVEILLARLFYGVVPPLASAYITGISVGMLIRSPEFWPYALTSGISITSKYALRVDGRHLWNPSNFGVSAMLFLAPATVASLSIQWGNNVWPMLVIWALGSVILSRLRRLHICIAYVTAFIVLASIRSLLTGHPFLGEIAPITGAMYQLFVFFMITDPRTTVRARRGQIVVVVLVAVVEMVLRLNEVVHAPYYALFVVGPVANAVEIWRDRRLRSAAPARLASARA